MIHQIAENIRWLGHDSFRIDISKTIYLDPYQISPGPTADLILISHMHHDHCSPDDVAIIQGPDTIIVTEKDSARKLKGDLRVIRPGDSINVENITIDAVPSYNTDKAFHPEENGWLGFILNIEGVRVYHAGDTDFIPEMRDFHVDIALIPVSGKYVMTWKQAVEAALALNPKLAIPMHYGSVVGSEQDAINFKKALEGRIEVHILQKEV